MRLLAWVSLAFLMGAYICRPIGDPDLWWHITVGRWIVAHQDVPHVDYWNMFGVGKPWLAYSWSNEIVYALVDSFYGEKGLIIAQLLLAIGIAFAMQYVCSKISGSFWFGALLGAYATVSFHAHFSLRPQALVWMLFAVCLWFAECSRRQGLSGRQLFTTALLGCLWANSHVSGVVGLVSIFVWHMQSGAEWLWLKRAGLMMACFLLGTLVTPYFGKEWLTALEVSGHVGSLKGLDEFQPATILQHSTGMLLLQVVLLGLLCFLSRVTPPVGALLVGLGTVLAGLGVVKFMPFAAIALSALLAVWWREWISTGRAPEAESPLVRALMLGEKWMKALHPQTLGALAFFIVCLAWIYAAYAIKHPVNEVLIPKKSLAFLKEQHLSPPVLTEMGTGGPLMYEWSSPQGEPAHLVAVDGRTNVNSPAVWRSLQKALFGQEGWSEYIDLVAPQTILWRNASPFVALLIESPRWCRVFQSGRLAADMSVFVPRELFESRRGDLKSDDCA
jgi:hypothetical protein